MRCAILAAAVAVVVWPGVASGQFGGFGGRGGRNGGEGMGREAAAAPKLPGPELDGPPDSAAAQTLLGFSAEQAARYVQMFDSFMVATKPQRDSAQAAIEKMNDRLDAGDRAAALFYAERLQDLGRVLKDRQDKFEDQLHQFLTGDQLKTYRRWKEDQEREAAAKAREDALRWREAAFGGERMGGAVAPERKTFIPSPPGLARSDLGSVAVRVGRTVYVSSQLPLDSAGGVVASGDLRGQADRAFANLAAVLRAAGAWPQDVVTLTIYVVDYRPSELATIRDAGASYFGANPPVVTVLGVQALPREGALIAVAGTAVTATPGAGRGPGRER